MAHILCITSGLTGILNSSYELVSRLEALGHSVSYGSPRDVREKVEAQGIRFYQLPNVFTEPGVDNTLSKGIIAKVGRLLKKLRTIKKRREAAFLKLQTTPYKQTINSINPDLVLIDIEIHEFILANHEIQQPQILLSPWFTIWRNPGIPPITSNAIPGVDFKGSKIGISLEWLTTGLKRKWGVFKHKLGSGFADRRSALLSYAKTINFPQKNIQKGWWPLPFTYNNIPVFSMTPAHLEFTQVQKPWLKYLGPLVKANRVDLKSNSTVDNAIRELTELKATEKISVIYCALSTTKQPDQAFVKQIMEAVKDKPNWKLIIGMGNTNAIQTFDQIPENVYVFPWVPQPQVLQIADCCINQGGINTINECIHFNIPMLIYSGKKHDQNGCATRLFYHGLAANGDREQTSSVEIQRKINEVLSNPEYRKKVEMAHQNYLETKTSNTLADSITKHCRKTTAS